MGKFIKIVLGTIGGIVVLLFGISVAAALLMPKPAATQTAVAAPAPAPTPAPTAKPQATAVPTVGTTWVTVAEWEGRGNKTTEPFTIASEQWRVVTDAKMVPGQTIANQLCLTAKSLPPGGKEPPGSIGCLYGQQTSYRYDRGTFYLEIRGANDGWQIVIEELR